MSRPDGIPSVVRLANITKRFGGVTALSDVNLTLEPGEVVGLVGENGSGKSTLIKVLAGIVTPDSGTVEVDGKPLDGGDLAGRVHAGVGVVLQEAQVCPELEVAENISLGRMAPKRRLISWSTVRSNAAKVLSETGLVLPIRRKLRTLSQDEAHLTDVVRLIARGCHVLVFDETTASLTTNYVSQLFDVIERARAQGTAILIVTHRLNEIFAITTRVVVLRDGLIVADTPTAQTDEATVIRNMVGRELSGRQPRNTAAVGDPLLRIENLVAGRITEPLNLTARPGQVLGIGGLVGSGRSTVLEAIYGLIPRIGVVTIDGVPLRANSVRDSIKAGIGFVPEDRRADGLAMDMSVRANAAFVASARKPMFSWVRRSDEEALVNSMRSQLGLKAANASDPVRNLSGGNQQKIVLGRWLADKPRVLLLDEPTRGIDVGAKSEIYRLIDQLAQDGVAILVVTSELEELLALSDDIIVLREGRVTARLTRGATEEEVAVAMAGSPKFLESMSAKLRSTELP